jgi:hypothetical protein
MLAVSAMMLATSTYAWFTMAREVEVTNIQMTASVPADLQISLGRLSTAAGSGNGLVNNQGVLVPVLNTADNGGVADPGDIAEYWSNTADVSAYYSLGRIIPASSTDGLNIFFTPDASGVGKTLKANAQYFTATRGATIEKDTNGNSYETTLHAKTIANDPWTAQKAKEYDVTNDDGYFVDIPVWIRSSSTETGGVPLSVDAYVTTNAKYDEDDLYLAARAVILGTERNSTSGLIEIKQDGYGTPEAPGTSIVNFMDTTNASGAAVKNVDDATHTATYGQETYYDGTTAHSGVLVPASATEGQYGDAIKIWIRVWLEGEDPNCWNANAGQDFNISLKFARTDVNMPTTNHYNSTTANTGTETSSLNAGTPITVNYPDNGGSLGFTYDGTRWTLDSGSTFKAPTLGNKYNIDGVAGLEDFDNVTALLNYLNTNIDTADEVAPIVLTNAAQAGRKQVMYSVTTADTEGTFSASLPTEGVVNYTVNGVTYADEAAIKAACTAVGNYVVTINYSAAAPTYTVSYTNVTISGDTLKLMRLATTASGTTTYKWYIAGENTFAIGTGYEVTTKVATAGNGYTTLSGIVTALNTSNSGAAPETCDSFFTDVAKVAKEQTFNVTVPIQDDPNATTIKLVKKVTGTDITWALATGQSDYSAGTGFKLKYNSETTEYASVSEIITALNAAKDVADLTIKYVAAT